MWGRLRDWKQALGRPVVLRAKGRGVSLTEFAGRLLDAQSRALARMAPDLDNIAGELEMIEARPARDLRLYLASENVAALLAGLPGYAPGQSGQVRPLEQGLPW